MNEPRLRHNIAALGSLQVLNYAAGLAILPYVTRVLGADSWGRVALALLVLNYLTWLTNWGFQLRTTRNVAARRHDDDALRATFAATWMAQWVLVCAALVLGVAAVLAFPSLRREWSLYACGAGLVVGNVLFPCWWFMGLEKMKEMALVQLAIKLPAIPLVFLFVRTVDDGAVYIAVQAACSIVGGVLALMWCRRHTALLFVFPHWTHVWIELRSGASLFVSSLVGTVNGTATPLILNAVAGPAALGYFAVADRITRAALAAFAPVVNAVFPRMCNLYASDKVAASRLLRRTMIVLCGSAALLALSTAVCAAPLTWVIGGSQFRRSTDVLRWLSPIIFLATVSTFLGLQVLIPRNYTKAYAWSYVLAACCGAVVSIPLAHWRGEVGAAMALTLAEAVIVILMIASVLSRRRSMRTRPTGDAGASGHGGRAIGQLNTESADPRAMSVAQPAARVQGER